MTLLCPFGRPHLLARCQNHRQWTLPGHAHVSVCTPGPCISALLCPAEQEELKRLLPEMVRFEPTWEELELYKDGGIAIIDQWICAHARC